jgi:Cu/Ag efflux protein CusF
MSPSHYLGRRALRVGPILLALSVTSTACREGSRAPAAGGASNELHHRYSVRGEIVSLPGAGARQLSLRHEAIDDFADAGGKVVGMGSMVMPFDLAPGVALDGLQAGDKVEARIAVGWSPSLLQVEQLRKLPADTPLEFRAARPPSGARP